MTWHILGAGAIGCLWATKLARQSNHCVLLKRADSNQAIAPYQQLNISFTDLDHHQRDYQIESQPIHPGLSISHLLVCTKSYQTEAAIKSIRSSLTADATIVLLQNGMGQQQIVSDLLASQTLLIATTTEGALLTAKSAAALQLTHSGAGVSYFGKFQPQDIISPEVQQSLSAIDMCLQTDISSLILNKLAINCVINPLSALYNCTNGQLYKSAELLVKVEQLSAEVDRVMTALAVAPANHLNRTLQQVLVVAKATENNFSSMQQDIKHRRKTEISFINGYLQRRANQLNIHLPYNQRILQKIQCLEQSFNNRQSNGEQKTPPIR